jgi:hypothetical protein
MTDKISQSLENKNNWSIAVLLFLFQFHFGQKHLLNNSVNVCMTKRANVLKLKINENKR